MDSEWKFRCDADLLARFERIATLRRRRFADFSRMVFEDFVSAEERALGLVLPTQAAALRETPAPYNLRTPADPKTPDELADLRTRLEEIVRQQQTKSYKRKRRK